MAGSRKVKKAVKRGARMLAAQRQAAAGQGARTTRRKRAESGYLKAGKRARRELSGQYAGMGASYYSGQQEKKDAKRYGRRASRRKAK